jgi:DNA polymerase I-like protein with 3'-5' exonuclease and polymerase domains
VNTIHDENVVECPVSVSKTIAEVVKKSMYKAGRLYCKRVPLTAEPEISPYWKK